MRPPDETHGSGDETIRPQRSSEAERSSEKKVHKAHCSDNFVPRDSNLKTKKSASGKRPPDEAHGSGDETIRPQRSSEAAPH